MHPSSTHINRIIFVLSLVGMLMAIYVLQSFLRQTSIVCVTTGCEAVRKAPQSWLFGTIPVPAIGLVGYTILAVCAFLKTTHLSTQMEKFVGRISLFMAAFGVAFVSWFTYTELFIIKGICTWCALSAINMVIIFFFLITQKKAYETH